MIKVISSKLRTNTNEQGDNLQGAQGGAGGTVDDTGRQTRSGGWERTGGGERRVLSVSRGGEDSDEGEFLDEHYR